MNASRKWFDRKFDLGLSDESFPEELSRLGSIPDRIEDVVRGLSTGDLVRRENDTWSILENIGHLADLDELLEGRLDDFEAGLATLRGADLENRKTHEARYNERTLAQVLGGFREKRRAIVERIRALDSAVLKHSAMHPRLRQPMRVVDLMHFHVEHDDHHLTRIHELAHTAGASRR